MQPNALLTIYDGWRAYQGLLTRALAPLSAEQLALRAAPGLRSVGELAAHIAGGRAFWFHDVIGEGDQATVGMPQWQGPNATPRTAAELVAGFEATWHMIEAALARWTPEVMAQPFTTFDGRGRAHTQTRQWIIWHLIEHDLHHGGEIAYMLGAHGLKALAM